MHAGSRLTLWRTTDKVVLFVQSLKRKDTQRTQAESDIETVEREAAQREVLGLLWELHTRHGRGHSPNLLVHQQDELREEWEAKNISPNEINLSVPETQVTQVGTLTATQEKEVGTNGLSLL